MRSPNTSKDTPEEAKIREEIQAFKQKMHLSGITPKDIAREYNLSASTINEWLRLPKLFTKKRRYLDEALIVIGKNRSIDLAQPETPAQESKPDDKAGKTAITKDKPGKKPGRTKAAVKVTRKPALRKAEKKEAPAAAQDDKVAREQALRAIHTRVESLEQKAVEASTAIRHAYEFGLITKAELDRIYDIYLYVPEPDFHSWTDSIKNLMGDAAK